MKSRIIISIILAVGTISVGVSYGWVTVGTGGTQPNDVYVNTESKVGLDGGTGNNYIISPGTGQVSIYSGGTQTLTAYNGLVGLGTSSPSGLLQMDSSGDGAQLLFSKSGTLEYGIQKIESVNPHRLRVYYYPTNNEVFTLLTSGNVGLGTTNPQNKLDVNGGLAVGSYAGVNAAPTNGAIISGGVGIGTSSPQNPLSVAGTLQADSSNTGDTSQLLFSKSGTSKFGIQKIESDSTGRLRIYDYANSAERFTLLTSGNVGIGTSTPAQKLDVAGNIDISTGSKFYLDGGTDSNYIYYDSTNKIIKIIPSSTASICIGTGC
ncbi:MAG: hypothetical protein KGI25_00200 [Thaumarchaeota archaeon]|nr:hypothetical protein [Nitrososphaerota archaeon]